MSYDKPRNIPYMPDNLKLPGLMPTSTDMWDWFENNYARWASPPNPLFLISAHSMLATGWLPPDPEDTPGDALLLSCAGASGFTMEGTTTGEPADLPLVEECENIEDTKDSLRGVIAV